MVSLRKLCGRAGVVVLGVMLAAAYGAEVSFRIANMNWALSDLQSMAARQSLAFPPDIGAGGSSSSSSAIPRVGDDEWVWAPSDSTASRISEYGNSAAAVTALSGNEVDVVVECWNMTTSRCDSIPDTNYFVYQTGAHAARLSSEEGNPEQEGQNREGLYVLKHTLQWYPALSDIKNWAAGNPPVSLRVLGPVSSWSAADKLRDFFATYHELGTANPSLAYLGAKMELFDDEPALNSEVLVCVRTRQHCLFYGYEPGAMVFAYGEKYFEVVQDSAGVLESLFPRNNVLFVWRPAVSERLNSALLQGTVADQLNADTLESLTTTFKKRVALSMKTEDSPSNYDREVSGAAREWFCATVSPPSAEQHCTSDPVVWPRAEKDSLLPEKLVIWTKVCPGFAMRHGDDSFTSCEMDDPANSDEEGRKDLHGYSIDHAKRVTRYLGYSERDLIWRCAPSTPKLIELAADGLADMTVACITINEPRSRMVDWSAGYFSTGYRWLRKRRSTRSESVQESFNDLRLDDVLWVIKPFTTTLWVTLIIVVLIVGILIYAVDQMSASWSVLGNKRFGPKHKGVKKKHDAAAERLTISRTSSWSSSSRRSLSALFSKAGNANYRLRWRQNFLEAQSAALSSVLGYVFRGDIQARDQPFNTAAARSIWGVFAFAGMLVWTFYVSNVTVFLTIENLQELTQGNVQGSKVATHCATYGKNFVQEYFSDHDTLNLDLYCAKGGYAGIVEAVRNGREGVVYGVYDASTLEYIAVQSNCELEVVHDVFGPQEYGYAFPKGSKLRKHVSDAILHLRVKEDIEAELRPQYFTSDCGNGGVENLEKGARALGLREFAGLFVVAFVVCGVVLVIAVLFGANSSLLDGRFRSRSGDDDAGLEEGQRAESPHDQQEAGDVLCQLATLHSQIPSLRHEHGQTIPHIISAEIDEITPAGSGGSGGQQWLGGPG